MMLAELGVLKGVLTNPDLGVAVPVLCFAAVKKLLLFPETLIVAIGVLGSNNGPVTDDFIGERSKLELQLKLELKD